MVDKGRSISGGARDLTSRRSFMMKTTIAASVGVLPTMSLAKEATVSENTNSAACLTNSRQIDLTATGSGRSYRLKVAVPLAPAPEAGHPLLFVLDGDAYFGALTDTTRNLSVIGGEIAAPIVIGVGYPDDDTTAWYFRRATDYTPTEPAEGDGPVQASEAGFAGFSSFLNFLVDDALPAIGKVAAIDASRVNIFGHSFGGLAALHSLFSRPDIFAGAAAISPSIYWGDEALLATVPGFLSEVETKRLSRKAFVAVGELEETFVPRAEASAELQAAQRQAIRHARLITRAQDLTRTLSEPLRARGGSARFRLVPGASHVSAPYAALPPALDLLLPRLKAA